MPNYACYDIKRTVGKWYFSNYENNNSTLNKQKQYVTNLLKAAANATYMFT